jgi:cytochrome b6-f complex iron-sulfur subunit
MERRQLLKTSLAFLGTTTLISFVYPASKFLVPPKSSAKDAQVTLDKDQIPTGTAKEITYNDIPLILINRRGSGFIALSRVCTHLGCLVGYDSFNNKLVCPCHAGEFDLEGNVLSGPATKALKRYPLKISSKQITIG